MAAELEQSDSDVLVRAGDSQSHLHDQYDWVAQYDAAEDHQKPSDVPVGWSGIQDTLLSLEKHQQTVDNADTELERRVESIRHSVWKPITE